MFITFLELFMVSNKKTLKLENPGDIIMYFRQQYLAPISRFAYTYAVNRVSADAVISKLMDSCINICNLLHNSIVFYLKGFQGFFLQKHPVLPLP